MSKFVKEVREEAMGGILSKKILTEVGIEIWDGAKRKALHVIRETKPSCIKLYINHLIRLMGHT